MKECVMPDLHVLSEEYLSRGEYDAALRVWIDHRRQGRNVVAVTFTDPRATVLIGCPERGIEAILGHEAEHLAIDASEGYEVSRLLDRTRYAADMRAQVEGLPSGECL